MSRKKIITGFLILGIVTGTSVYLEVLGNRIIDPDLSFSDMWGWPFISGSLRTAFGATLMGFLFVLITLIPGRIRDWSRSHSIQIWSAGAALFLLIITFLILWAPWLSANILVNQIKIDRERVIKLRLVNILSAENTVKSLSCSDTKEKYKKT